MGGDITKAEIKGNTFLGEIMSPPSKSCAHRRLIASCLGSADTKIKISEICEDVEATISCLHTMGANFEYENGILTVSPIKEKGKSVTLNAKESSSTLRFMLPLSLVLCQQAKITGEGIILLQPIAPLSDELRRKGFIFNGDKLPFTVAGNLKPGLYNLKGDLSSQFVSSLLMSLPLLQSDSEIVLSLPLFKESYVALTVRILKECGIFIEKGPSGIFICGNQRYTPPFISEIEGDYSLSAFHLGLGCACGEVKTSGLNMDSMQGEREIISIIRSFGGKVEREGNSFRAVRSTLKGTTLNLENTPDLIPPSVVLSLYAEGETVFRNLKKLAVKDEKRLSFFLDNLKILGADFTRTKNELIIRGKKKLKGGTVSSCNDHRIAMALSCLSPLCDDGIILEGCEAVKRSYPSFFKDFVSLGGKFREL